MYSVNYTVISISSFVHTRQAFKTRILGHSGENKSHFCFSCLDRSTNNILIIARVKTRINVWHILFGITYCFLWNCWYLCTTDVTTFHISLFFSSWNWNYRWNFGMEFWVLLLEWVVPWIYFFKIKSLRVTERIQQCAWDYLTMSNPLFGRVCHTSDKNKSARKIWS